MDLRDTLDAPDIDKKVTPNYRPLLIWGGLIIIGFLFRVLHWPGSSLLILSASGGITAYPLCKVLMITRTKDPIFLATAVPGVIWFLFLLLSAYIFNYPFNFNGIILYLISFLVFAAFYSIISLIRLKNLK